MTRANWQSSLKSTLACEYLLISQTRYENENKMDLPPSPFLYNVLTLSTNEVNEK